MGEKSNLKVIPNPLGFEITTFNNLQSKKIIAVGSHSLNKGYDLLLEVWRKIEKLKTGWELHIYGKYDGNRMFINMAKDLELNSVFFHPPVSDIKTAYLQSSIMVLSSRSEGFGMVLIEAMECGLPCVSFNCTSGPADIIRDGVDGFLVPAENVEAMTEKINMLIKDEELRKQMGVRAKENVQRFNAREIVAQWDQLFQELASNNR